MAAFYCLWIAEEHWAARARDDRAEARHELGTAVLAACRTADFDHPAVGVLQRVVPSAEGSEEVLHVPMLLETAAPLALYWNESRAQIDGSPDLDVVLSSAPPAATSRRQVFFSVEEGWRQPDPEDLGGAILELLLNRDRTQAPAANIYVVRGAAVSANDECYLIFLRGAVLDPGRLTESQRTVLVEHWGRNPHVPVQHDLGRLTLLGVRVMPSDRASEAYLEVPPASTTILFGKNGAGKTLALQAVTDALRGVSKADQSVGLILGCEAQEQAPRQFVSLLVHLAFSELSELSSSARAVASATLRAGLGTSGGVEALPLPLLMCQPLADLRAALLAALIEELALAIPSEPLIPLLSRITDAASVEYDGSQSAGGLWLVDDVRKPSEDCETAARVLVTAVESGATSLAGARYRIYEYARALLEAEPTPRPFRLLHVTLGDAENALFAGTAEVWQAAGTELRSWITSDLPRPVVFSPGALIARPDVERQCEEALLELLSACLGQDGDSPEHPFGAYPSLTEHLRQALLVRTTELLPRFIKDGGTLSIRILDPTQWHRARIRVEYTEQGRREPVPADFLPSGIRTWIFGSLTFAVETLLRSEWTGQAANFGSFRLRLTDDMVRFGTSMQMSRSSVFVTDDVADFRVDLSLEPYRIYFLLDEPEVHLHATAVHDVVELVQQLSASSQGAMVATHSLAFLDAPSANGRVLTVTNTEGRATLKPWAGLRQFADMAQALGAQPSAIAQLCRGVLLVEGPDDVEVIRRFGGVSLEDHRVITLIMYGEGTAAGLAEAEFLHGLRIPLFVLLDHVRREALETRLATGHGGFTREERTLEKLHQSLRHAGLQMWALPFRQPDILAAVPDHVVAHLVKAAGGRDWTNWRDFGSRAEAAHAKSGIKFKDSFRAETGIDVPRLMRSLRESDFSERSPELHGVLASMLNVVDHPDPPALRSSADGTGLHLLKFTRG